MNTTTTANNSAVLLPVIDGPLAGCRKQVCFVRVQLNLDISSLASQGVQGVTILRVEYHIELPQGLRNLQNGNNQGYRLTPSSVLTTSALSPPLTSHKIYSAQPFKTAPSTYFVLILISRQPKRTHLLLKQRSTLKSSIGPHLWFWIVSSTNSALGIQRSLTPPSTTSGRCMKTWTATPSSLLSTIITPKSSLPPAPAWTRRPF